MKLNDLYPPLELKKAQLAPKVFNLGNFKELENNKVSSFPGEFSVFRGFLDFIRIAYKSFFCARDVMLLLISWYFQKKIRSNPEHRVGVCTST